MTGSAKNNKFEFGDSPWLFGAKCNDLEDPDIFFEPKLFEKAIKICGECAVRKQCLENALRTPYGDDRGFKGGLTQQERQDLRVKRKG
jgi:hypothetical protein